MEQTAYLPHNYEEKLKALNAVIWDAAELKFAETKSAKAMTDFLRQEGFTVKEGLAGMKTSYVAEFGSGHPIIGILAEYDALSGLSQELDVAEKATVWDLVRTRLRPLSFGNGRHWSWSFAPGLFKSPS